MYTTNSEYRQAIREFCKMNCEPIELDIDDESKEELLYDVISSKKTLDFIYEKTKENPLWQQLYEKAAGKFLSTDREIGLSVLFCYDYFWYFKKCWDSFLENVENFDENNEFYKSLNSIL